MQKLWTVALVGIAFAVVACSEDSPQAVTPAQKSQRGETCGTRNDCRDGLACIQSRCVQDEYPIAATAKECVLIQCTTTADCCDNFVPPSSCESYKMSCDAGDQVYCEFYEQSCVCNQECQNEQCVLPTPECMEDIDCIFGGVCEAGACVECRADEDCPEGGRCVGNVCQGACTRNEECALFHSCQDGQCVETGCTSDRECILFTGDAQSTCSDGTCRVPCESNSQCGQLQVCDEGVCVFIGCETDAECRTYLQVQFQENVSAVCRDSETVSN